MQCRGTSVCPSFELGRIPITQWNEEDLVQEYYMAIKRCHLFREFLGTGYICDNLSRGGGPKKPRTANS